jgi:hypothetical protein
MSVQAVLAKGHDDVRTEPSKCLSNGGLEPPRVGPGKHAIVKVQQDDVGDTENPRGIPQFTSADVTKIDLRRTKAAPLSELASSRAAHRHTCTPSCAGRQQSAAGQRFIVRVREHGQERPVLEVGVVSFHSVAPAADD